jgi:hypothetical protein
MGLQPARGHNWEHKRLTVGLHLDTTFQASCKVWPWVTELRKSNTATSTCLWNLVDLFLALVRTGEQLFGQVLKQHENCCPIGSHLVSQYVC